jgi:hypothetical protein
MKYTARTTVKPALKIQGQKLFCLVILLLLLAACRHFEQIPLYPLRTDGSVQFAVIGDYGKAGIAEWRVARLVKSWQPDFILTTGDNNYSFGSRRTLDRNVGQYYHDYISPYRGDYGEGSNVNRFFPSLGNHDWRSWGAAPYIRYFKLPGNERYYDFVLGPVHVFCIDSNPNEPDGISADSLQALWLKNQLALSQAPWRIVYMHHAPFSSSAWHGSHKVLQWPYNLWGVTAVIAGHDHQYERLVVEDVHFFVNGVGGHPTFHDFGTPLPGSQVRYNKKHGAMRIEATDGEITFRFITHEGELIDRLTILKK